MLKGYYVNGFLYHEPTNQILLQQLQSTSPSWSLFESEEVEENTSPVATFAELIHNTLQLKLVIKTIQEVYSYLNEEVNKNYSITYAPVTSLKTALATPRDGKIYKWFGPREILKLNLSAQTRHDVTVGQRVIDAKMRKLLGLHTFE
ncbi:MAG TPA: hypothetical protein VEW42_00945 [Candidatus Eisenbacteria bacterium]|nr:hypothetical protein [Candidatus Eisenbacteria bacterium]